MTLELTPEQASALDAIKDFLRDDSLDAFVLRGSADTGKTTLIAKVVDAVDEMNLSCALLAPTGRAARILGSKIGQLSLSKKPGHTIHREIYSLTQVEVNEEAETANDPGLRLIFPLKKDEALVSLFVVDESSMVGDKESHGDFVQFGSGRLLKDLVTFARTSRPGRPRDHLTKLLFVGDPAQLPPIGDDSSPALSDDYLGREYGLQVRSFDLKTVIRQAQGSAILERATELRDALLDDRFNTFSLKPYQQDIEQVEASAALDLIVRGLRGKESSVAVVSTNAAALDYNRSIRARLWGDPNLPIQVGDTLLVNQNSPLNSLNNGDLVKVIQVDEEPERVPVSLKGGHHVELWFRKVLVAYRAADGGIITAPCRVLENLLDSPNRVLAPLEQRALLVHFRKRFPDLHPKSDEFRQTIKNDPYFNALQVKYGYAMTCHKAQGGEWNTVIVDFTRGGGVRNAAFFRWSYTAITRAAKKLIVVNPPEFTAVSEMVWAQSVPAAAPDPTGQENPSDDPDWDRLSFSAATAQLMPKHRQLRSVWHAQGVAIEQLQHLQYCERYTVARDGKRATVQYYYDKKHRVGRVAAMPGVMSDGQLANDALAALRALAEKPGSEQPDQFIQAFLDRLDAALIDSGIRRAAFRPMPYRLRVSFAEGARTGDVDFTYDGSCTWTAAQEVGGPGSSHGLYDEVQRLMIARQGSQS